MPEDDKPEINNIVNNNLHIILIIFIVYGMISKFIIRLKGSLDSDCVNPGMICIDIWKNNNYLLNSYYFPANDPFWFSDILPFHLIPQIISNFDPLALKVVCYIIFLLIILVFAILIYNISNSRIAALTFAALFINIIPTSFAYYEYPACHNATLFFTGLLMLALINKKYKLNAKFIACILLIDLMVFSDSIFIAWFVIPFVVYYLVFYQEKTTESNIFLILLIASSVFTYVYKSFFISTLLSTPISIENMKTALGTNIPLYLSGLSYISTGEPYNFALYLIFLILLSYASISMIKSKKLLPIFVYFLVATLVISMGYIFTSISVDMSTTRYMIFILLSIYVIIALSNKWNNNAYAVLIFILLISSAISNYYFIDLGFQANKDELDLIEYLKDNNLKYGYGDYWDSNIITYLSRGDIEVLSSFVNYDDIEPYLWLSCKQWYDNRKNMNDDYFILVSKNVSLLKGDVDTYTKQISPKKILYFKNYIIYVFDGPAPINTESSI